MAPVSSWAALLSTVHERFTREVLTCACGRCFLKSTFVFATACLWFIKNGPCKLELICELLRVEWNLWQSRDHTFKPTKYHAMELWPNELDYKTALPSTPRSFQISLWSKPTATQAIFFLAMVMWLILNCRASPACGENRMCSQPRSGEATANKIAEQNREKFNELNFLRQIHGLLESSQYF